MQAGGVAAARGPSVGAADRGSTALKGRPRDLEGSRRSGTAAGFATPLPAAAAAAA